MVIYTTKNGRFTEGHQIPSVMFTDEVIGYGFAVIGIPLIN